MVLSAWILMEEEFTPQIVKDKFIYIVKLNFCSSSGTKTMVKSKSIKRCSLEENSLIAATKYFQKGRSKKSKV